jgi:type IV secretory pathway ATPase VirB11/archaellum biosynthesis ATPase
MIIGGYRVGDSILKTLNEKKNLVFNCKNCVYSASLADDKACRLHVCSVASKDKPNLIVLADVYERVYDEKQTSKLTEIANLLLEFEQQGVWSPEHLSDGQESNEQYTAGRHALLVKVSHELLAYDPILAYLTIFDEVKKEKMKMAKMPEAYQKGAIPYLETLIYLFKKLEETQIISETKKYLQDLQTIPDTSQLYRSIFNAEIKPSFIGSRLLFGETQGLQLVDEYNVKDTNVQIFKHPEQVEYWYLINPPEYTLTPEKYFIISKTKEIVAEYRPASSSSSVGANTKEYFKRVFLSTVKGVAKAYKIPLSLQEQEALTEIVTRYTVGYGILELLLEDRTITDIYVDAPIGNKPIKLIHSKFGECKTNILYSVDEAKSVVSKLRSESGRPFDEAHPVLDYDLPDFDTRVAVIGPPLSPDGLAFAFRLHKNTPWTLPQLIDVRGINSLSAGMLSFFVDMQSTIMVAGSRGSGKTSLMTALMLEIPQSTRILCQEDTLELPGTYMKNIGFNIQRLKTQSAISVSKTGIEVPPDEALRVGLRLGDSSIIVGEVRSVEAKVLYEAMRVGAAGNVVMGTIHGDSAYSVWDRVVNDLEVPTTSFKATDIITVSRPIRFEGSLKRVRRLTEITEVKKHWISDPQNEGGLLDLMQYSAKYDRLDLMEDNLKDSDLFNKIQRVSGMNMDQIWKNISMLSESKQYLVDTKNKIGIADMLEAENTLLASNKLKLLKEASIEEHGKANYSEVLEQWKTWVNNEFLTYIKNKYGNK